MPRSSPEQEGKPKRLSAGACSLASVTLRVLFLSDTHLGLDLPSRPRVERSRRGDDLFERFERALEPVTRGEARVLVHGGDLFYRSRIPARLAERVFARLPADLADAGIEVFWVPGNHERGGVPRELLLTHPGIHVFDRPRTFVVRHDGVALALSGFPHAPRVRDDFPALLAATGHAGVAADVRLLCLHRAGRGGDRRPGRLRLQVGRGRPPRSRRAARLRGRPLGAHTPLAGPREGTSRGGLSPRPSSSPARRTGPPSPSGSSRRGRSSSRRRATARRAGS